jgi:outer membrane immunogenic protein
MRSTFTRTIVASLALLALSGIAARAADLPTVKGPPPAPAPAYVSYSWTGFYIGGQLGGAWNDSSWSTAPGMLPFPAFGTPGSGFLYGGQAGYNYQIGQFVLGAEGDLSGLALTGDNQCSNAVGTTCQTTQDWLGSIRARAGFAIDRLLIYGDGGVAFTDYHFAETVGVLQSWGRGSWTGWTLGLGAEYALTDHITAGVEYNYYDFGAAVAGGGTPPSSIKFTESENTVVAKVSYKF